jgi:hypothetical protein
MYIDRGGWVSCVLCVVGVGCLFFGIGLRACVLVAG